MLRSHQDAIKICLVHVLSSLRSFITLTIRQKLGPPPLQWKWGRRVLTNPATVVAFILSERSKIATHPDIVGLVFTITFQSVIGVRSRNGKIRTRRFPDFACRGLNCICSTRFAPGAGAGAGARHTAYSHRCARCEPPSDCSYAGRRCGVGKDGGFGVRQVG
jgi:hypothetical protein